jgi:hypothetical protein
MKPDCVPFRWVILPMLLILRRAVMHTMSPELDFVHVAVLCLIGEPSGLMVSLINCDRTSRSGV